MASKKVQVVPDYEISMMATTLLSILENYFSDPENEAAYQEWKKETGYTDAGQEGRTE